MKPIHTPINLSLSQLYQSEIKQQQQPERILKDLNGSAFKFKFDSNFSDRKQRQPQQQQQQQQQQYQTNLDCGLRKSSIFEDYKFEMENGNSCRNNNQIYKFNHLNSSSEFNYQKPNIQNVQGQYQSNQALIGSKMLSPLQKMNHFIQEDLESLRFSQQFQKLHFNDNNVDDYKISLYYYKPQIGITYQMKENLLLVTIDQSQITKIRQYLNEFQIDTLIIFYSINFPQQLLMSIKQIIQGVVKFCNFMQWEEYNIQDKLTQVGFMHPEIYNETLIDKQIYINLCSALPILSRSNLDTIINQLQENEKCCKLKFNDSLQNQLGILKQENKQLSIQQLFEKYFQTFHAKKIFLDYLKNPISSYQIINKRLQNLYIFQQLSLQPSNQKFIKMPGKIGSFTQILKVLSTYQEKSEPYSKLFTQLQYLIEFVTVVKQLVVIDRRAQQQTCQLLKDLSNVNLESICQLSDIIETSLLFNQSNVQIKEQKYPQLEQLLSLQINLKTRIQLIKNKHQSELALVGIKPQSIEVKYVNNSYKLVVQSNLNLEDKVQTLGWEMISERDAENFVVFKTSYTLSLDDQFGDLENQIISMQEKILIELVKQIQSYSDQLQQIEQLIGEIDYYIGLSIAITQMRLCIPKLNNNNQMKIQGGRHLLVEQTKKQNVEFQPNDFVLNDKRIFLIVGPNFSGKSVFIRQIGIIIYLVHCGLPVPALNVDTYLLEEIHALFPCEGKQQSNLSITNLELLQLSSALKVSSRSLVLMDEIGKTFKYQVGSNLHKSALEYFMQMSPTPPIVLSATHYQNHEELLQQKCLQQGEMEVAFESNKNLIFVYRIDFHSKRVQKVSFGLEVALLVHQNEELYQRGLQLYELLTKYKYLQNS
ncbi:unnamed protein product [Paramecium pentaurelia]|uniref:MutS-like protein n=1 Tax=Paramecium pentaurelia TaxID=43138 RepID=A0A8S1W3F3_9CILI|nr:unnamed protein product [Paramecium pentaurelia]